MGEKKENKIEIRLQPINVGVLKVPLKGKTPLLMDRFPDDTKREILAKQAGIAKGKAIERERIGNISEDVFTNAKQAGIKEVVDYLLQDDNGLMIFIDGDKWGKKLKEWGV